jgi:hypothetical protein
LRGLPAISGKGRAKPGEEAMRGQRAAGRRPKEGQASLWGASRVLHKACSLAPLAANPDTLEAGAERLVDGVLDVSFCRIDEVNSDGVLVLRHRFLKNHNGARALANRPQELGASNSKHPLEMPVGIFLEVAADKFEDFLR